MLADYVLTACGGTCFVPIAVIIDMRLELPEGHIVPMSVPQVPVKVQAGKSQL